MNLKHKWSAIAGTVVVAGGLLAAGAVYAADSAPNAAAPATTQTQKAAPQDRLADAVSSGKLTQAEADVLKQIDALRQTAMDKLKADSQAVIDQAVKDGKLTQEQADKLAKGGPGFGGPRGGDFGGGRKDGMGHDGGHRGGGKGFGHGNMTQEELKTKLDAEVQSGKLTQAQEDKMLQDFAQHQAEHAAPTQQQAAPTTETKTN
jgi:polyhydroxyalkanoate synthesis regulator phasin